MEELIPSGSPAGGEIPAPAPRQEVPAPIPVQEAAIPTPVQRAQVKQGPQEKKESPGMGYLKAIAVMMMVFLGIPVIGFLLLFPYFLSFMMYTPQFIPLLPVFFLAYYGVAAYWFFKKGGFKRMLNASTRFGMSWSDTVMGQIDPKIKKEMMEKAMKDDSVKQFKEQLKAEIRKEMQEEAARKRQAAAQQSSGGAEQGEGQNANY